MTRLIQTVRSLLVVNLVVAVVSCGESSDTNPDFRGFLWENRLVRLDTDDAWVETTGSQRWWFFNSGVFRQESQDYVEPQFYGDSQACGGVGGGTYEETGPGDEEPAEGDEEQKAEQSPTPTGATPISLIYDTGASSSGLCRMTDRTVFIFVQPSGVIDILDNRRVTRLDKIERVD